MILTNGKNSAFDALFGFHWKDQSLSPQTLIYCSTLNWLKALKKVTKNIRKIHIHLGITVLKNSKRVILITGTPCIGKTSTARFLAVKLNALHINLGELVKKEGMSIGVDELRDTVIADMEKLRMRVQEIIRDADSDVIVDGHFAMHVVPPKMVHKIFVVRREPAELKELMEKKGYVGRKLWENLAAEILDICLTDALSVCRNEKVCEIDATGRKPNEVANEILLILEGKKPCRVGVVDWLGELDAKGRLEEFLKDF